MSTFSKALKYRKPSHGINERIRFLNRQLMKFSENNTTAGVYSVVDTTSATAMIPPVVSAVPDTSGISNYSTFNQATNGGSNSDDSTWDTGWNSISQLYNSNTLEYDQQYLPILNNPWNTGDEDGNYGILGWETVHGNINFSTLTGENYHGSFDSGSPEEIAFDNACGTTPGINASGWIPWRVWEQYSLWNPRIDSYLPIPEHDGQYPKWTGPFKKVGSTYYCLVGSWRLYAGAAGEYTSQHAVKGYGAFTTLLDRWSLDDANYYPGNPAQSMYSYLDVGPYGFHQALDESASYSDDEWLNDWLWGSSSATGDTSPGVFSWSNYASGDNGLIEKGKEIWSDITDKLGNVGADFVITMNDVYDDAVEHIFTPLGEMGEEAFNNFVNNASDFANTIKDLSTNLAADIMNAEAAHSTLEDYNEFINNPLIDPSVTNSDGSVYVPPEVEGSPQNPKDISGNLTEKDIQQIINTVNNDEYVKKLKDGYENATTEEERNRNYGGLQLALNDVAEQISSSNYSLDNSWGGEPNVDVDAFLNDNVFALDKDYDFEPGGSVTQTELENPLFVAFADATDMPLDTWGSASVPQWMTIPGPNIIGALWGAFQMLVPPMVLGLEVDTDKYEGGILDAPGMSWTCSIPLDGGAPPSTESIDYKFRGEFIVEKNGKRRKKLGLKILGFGNPKLGNKTPSKFNESKEWFNADDIKPEYPNDPPPEMKGGWHPKLYDQKPNPMVSLERKKRKKEPYIKITEKDLLKNHKLKEEERKVMIKLIGQLNRWIDANPGRIEYIRERYPKNDPRLAMLNYKLDKREEASKKYIETHFPENKSVFERLKRMTRKNIEATQPHRFKSVINPPTYNDYDSHVVMPQLNTNAADTIKIKESFTKHFKKPVRLKSWHKGHLSSS